MLAVDTVWERGLYNPQTAAGDIVVDGFVASTYTTFASPRAAHALLAPLRLAASLGRVWLLDEWRESIVA